jgi:hypothetical protein
MNSPQNTQQPTQPMQYPQTVTVADAVEHGLVLNLQRAIRELRGLRRAVTVDFTRAWIAVRLKPRGSDKTYRYEFDPGAFVPDDERGR